MRISSIVVLYLFLIVSSSCGPTSFNVPPDLIGIWKSDSQKLTIRNKTEQGQYVFFSDTLSLSLEINSEKQVSGYIGTERFNQGTIRKNIGLPPNISGVAYVVECGSLGKLFESDPISKKSLELWIEPMKEKNKMTAELRYKDGEESFPMAEIYFTK